MLLRGLSISISDIVCLLDSGFTFAILEFWAVLTFCHLFIRCAFFLDKMSILSKDGVEVGPSTFTSFVHVVATEDLLRRQRWGVISIFDFQSWFSSLYKCNRIAWSASTLVSDLASEVISIEVSPVKLLWNFSIRNLIIWCILFLIFLSFLKCFFPLWSLTKLKLAFVVCLSKIDCLIFTVLCMVFLKFAVISLPTDFIVSIDSFN